MYLPTPGYLHTLTKEGLKEGAAEAATVLQVCSYRPFSLLADGENRLPTHPSLDRYAHTILHSMLVVLLCILAFRTGTLCVARAQVLQVFFQVFSVV